MKILIVEDNEDSRNLLMKQLRAYSHEVTPTANGAEALEQALAQSPDIIVSDIMMPKMDGYQLCHECKQNDKLKNIPFVFYTATYTREEDEKFALSLGGAAFVAKPTEPDVLVQMLSEIVEKTKSGTLAPAKVAPLEPSLFHTEHDKRIFAKLEDKVAQLEAEITKRKRIEYNLNKRVKELQSLYGIANIAERPGITLDEVYQEVVNLLTGSWQYPEITCARITFGDEEFRTDNFRTTEWEQSANINVKGQKEGTVEVYYLEARPEIDEGPFLKEERLLINAVAERLGRITERKQAEEKLKQATEEWRTTFDSITDLVFINDKDFRLIRVNKAFAGILKMKPKELIGKTCYEIIHGTKEPVPNCPHMKTLKTKKSATAEFFESHLGIHLEVSASPIFNEKGEVTASVHVARDITERKRMEEQLIVTDRLASIGELSSGIAHELNNPLTGVIGFSDLLLDRDLPDDIKEDLEIINREAKRTAGVVRNLLIFAREQGVEKKPVNINSIIEKVLELRAYEQKVHNIEVNTQFASALPEIMADGFRLQQVFINLIINAEHFMKEAHGRGTLTITTERIGDIIRASFADDGPGIAEENLKHLFDPFFTTKEVGKGTGLGLSISYGIITEHGGRIWAESELGKGATFVVELPTTKE